MAVSTRVKNLLNRLLAPVNLHLESLTAARQEAERIEALRRRGELDQPLYHRLPPVDEDWLDQLAELAGTAAPAMERLLTGNNDVGYRHDNGFFQTPDMQALYLTIRQARPGRIVEIGAGNSTRIARQAIMDGALSTRIVSIDPAPRADIAGYADEVIRERLEDLDDDTLTALTADADILFVDSSHQVRLASDVVRIICRLLPALAADGRGRLVHFHDIFLPWEYPRDFAALFPDWGEQYLLYTWLQASEVRLLWPGYLLQRSRPDIVTRLPFLDARYGRAQSFWCRLDGVPS